MKKSIPLIVILIFLFSISIFNCSFGKKKESSNDLITFWESEDGEAKDLLQKYAEEFSKKYNIKIVKEHKPPEGSRNEFQNAGIARNAPAFVIAPSDFAGNFTAVRLVLSIDDVFKDDIDDPELGNLSKEKYKEIFTPESLEPVKLEDKVWGVPLYIGNHLMMFYNKQYFSPEEEAKIETKEENKDIDKKSPKDNKKVKPGQIDNIKLTGFPTTTKEMIDASQSLQGKEFTITVYDGDPPVKKEKKVKIKYGLVYNLNEAFFFSPWVGGFGGQFLDKFEPLLDSDAMVNALNFVQELKFRHKIVPLDCNYEAADTFFKNGEAAIIINGDWAIKSYQRILGDNLGIANIPKVVDYDTEKGYGPNGEALWAKPLVGGKYIFVSNQLKSDKEKFDKVRKFIKFLISKSVEEELLTKFNQIPPRKEIIEGDIVKNNRFVSASIKQMKEGSAMPAQLEMRFVWDAMKSPLADVMTGNLKPYEAAENMQKAAKTQIRD